MDDGGELIVELVSADGAAVPFDDVPGFSLRRSSTPLPGAGAETHELTIGYSGDGSVEYGVRASLALPAAQEPPTWLIPGLVYGENRVAGCRRIFPRYERGTVDPAAMVSERWSFRSDR